MLAPTPLTLRQFEQFDVNRNGSIEISELEQLLRGASPEDHQIHVDRSHTPGSGAEDADGNRITAICNEFGYPNQPTIDEFQRQQQQPAYMTLQDARVEAMLHHALPIPARSGPKKLTHWGAPTPRPAGQLHPTAQPARPRPHFPAGAKAQPLELGPPALGGHSGGSATSSRWQRQAQRHWELWERRQRDEDRRKQQEFYNRRPWHSETYWPPGPSTIGESYYQGRETMYFGYQPRQTLLHCQWHQMQLDKNARLSPARRAKQVTSSINSKHKPPRPQPPYVHMPPYAPGPQVFAQRKTGLLPDSHERKKLEARQASLAEQTVAEAGKETIAHRQHEPSMPIPRALLDMRARASRLDQRAWYPSAAPSEDQLPLYPPAPTAIAPAAAASEKMRPASTGTHLPSVALPPYSSSSLSAPFHSADHQQKPATSTGHSRSQKLPERA